MSEVTKYFIVQTLFFPEWTGIESITAGCRLSFVVLCEEAELLVRAIKKPAIPLSQRPSNHLKIDAGNTLRGEKAEIVSREHSRRKPQLLPAFISKLNKKNLS